MSSTPLAHNQPGNIENRRLHTRRKIEELAYGTFGPDNGGILLDISEGGLRFYAVGVVGKDEFIPLHFKLPGMNAHVEATGQVVWSDDSGKGGGLRLVDLTEETRQRVKAWIAGEDSSAGTFAGQVTTHSGAAERLGASERDLDEPLPVLDEKEQPKAAPVRFEPRTGEPRQIFSSARVVATFADSASTLANSAPRIPAKTHEPEAQSAPRLQLVTFAVGVATGCVVVLAVIAGVRMLGITGRPTTPAAIAQASAGQHATVQGSQNSPVDQTVLNGSRKILSKEGVSTTPAADQGFINKTPTREKESSVPAARVEANARPPQDSPQMKQKNVTDVTSLVLPAPHVPMPPARAELREPSIGDGMPAKLISIDDSRTVGPSMPDLPKPPQASPETADRTASFMEAVLIQHADPVYPQNAQKKHIEGLVKVGATIGTDGLPRELKLVSGDPGLGQAAQDAISHWRYVPAVSGGVPVESHIVILINFQSKP